MNTMNAGLNWKLTRGVKEVTTILLHGKPSSMSSIICLKNIPNTTFIAAHFGWYANDLAKLDSLLTALPNVVGGIWSCDSRTWPPAQGSQSIFYEVPGQDIIRKDSWVPSEYATYFRVLETEDEYFPYHKKYHAFWRMYGMACRMRS
jgi:hypothetical protein